MPSDEDPRMLALLLGSDLDVSQQVAWALRLARQRKLDLLLLGHVESPDERISTVSLDTSEPADPDAPDIVAELRQLVAADPVLQAGPRPSPPPDAEGETPEQEQDALPAVVHVQLKLIHSDRTASLRRLVQAELKGSEVDLFAIASLQVARVADVALARERRLFFRYAPCDIALFQGQPEPTSFSRILVPMTSRAASVTALRVALDLAAEDGGTVTTVYVNPNVGVDAARIGERRLDRIVDRALGKLERPQPVDLEKRVVVDDDPLKGVQRVWEEGEHDVVVMGERPNRLEESFGLKIGKGVPIVFACDVSPLANRFREAVEQSIGRLIPQIERDARVSLVDQLQSSGALDFDFATLMVLSTVMTAIGLMQDSVAVVIGAMLVAPLMTPLVGLGLALVQGNPVLAKLALRSLGVGVGISLVGGLLVGLLSPGFIEPSAQMLARGGPGVLDLLVAFASGLAAAYALSRPNLIAALPGVAIAAALVPPIATAGLALSLGQFALALRAFLLFVVNMVTIVLAAVVSLRAVGIQNQRRLSRWTLVAINGVMASVVVLGFYLSIQPVPDELVRGVPTGLHDEIGARIAPDYRIETLDVVYDALGMQLDVEIAGRTPASEELAEQIRQLISGYYDEPIRVRVATRLEIRGQTPSPPAEEKPAADEAQ